MSEEIKKSFSGEPMKADARKDIDLINRYALKELKPEEVFCFSMNLCDTQVDRDNEMFSIQGLQKLARLFPGKPLISDHEWSADNQQGRIYRCQVVTEGDISRLRASIYMLRTAGTEETIRQIEAGILKEVSIGFANKKLICSICGEEMTRSFYGPSKCKNDHEKGNVYNGKTCVGIMADPTDAYEVSFVAVPSQREAGVTKGRHSGKQALSPEEWEYRKKAIEESNGVTIPDEAWNHIVSGEMSGKEVVAALKAQKQDKESSKSVVKNHPQEDFGSDCIEYAILPADKVDTQTYAAGVLAAAFAKQELNTPSVKILYFVPVAMLKKYGLEKGNVTFSNGPRLLGTIDEEANDRIYIRYDLDYRSTKRIVLHECYHLMQRNAGSLSPNLDYEAGAYQYGDEAVKRLEGMKPDDQRTLLFDALTDVKKTF